MVNFRCCRETVAFPFYGRFAVMRITADARGSESDCVGRFGQKRRRRLLPGRGAPTGTPSKIGSPSTSSAGRQSRNTRPVKCPLKGPYMGQQMTARARRRVSTVGRLRDALLAEPVGLDAPSYGGGVPTLYEFVWCWRLVTGRAVSSDVRERGAESACSRATGLVRWPAVARSARGVADVCIAARNLPGSGRSDP